MGIVDGDVPHVPGDDVVRLRLRLVAEEFFELLAASLKDRDITDSDEKNNHFDDCNLSCAEQIVMTAIDEREVAVDLPEFADALADLDYVIEGARLQFGIEGGPVADEVHRANLRKAGAALRSDGKVGKPANWVGPDVTGALVKQGWKR